MDPSQRPNFFPNYNFGNQPQGPDVQPQSQNMPFAMPQNFGMQYPYRHPYMPFGYQPLSENTYAPIPPHINHPTTDEPHTPRASIGSADIPSTQSVANKSSYTSWTTEDNKILLTAYYHFSNDSELGANQKGDTFWGKITQYVNENSQSGVERASGKCQSHFRDINKKISSFVGCYSTATREKHSGWSDDDYVSKALQLYHEKCGSRFNLIDEWKLVRNQPKYMTGVAESGRSGSKRKNGGDNVETIDPPLVRPEGRDAAKKKARASSSKSSTSRRTKFSYEAEFSSLVSARDNFEQARTSTVTAMLEYAAGQKEAARAKKMEMWMTLKQKERDDDEEEMFQMLTNELLGR